MRSCILQAIFSLLYGPLAPLHELVGLAAFGPAWPGRRGALLDRVQGSTGLVVDLGCGEGRLLTESKKRRLSAIGIEPSPAMVRRAIRRGVTVVRAEGSQLPLKEGVAEAVVATYPGPWIGTPETWREIERVLMPGGRAVILLGGTSERGRLAAVRSLVSSLVYRRRGAPIDITSLPTLGGAGMIGSWSTAPDEWGTALIWEGRRVDASGA